MLVVEHCDYEFIIIFILLVIAILAIMKKRITHFLDLTLII